MSRSSALLYATDAEWTERMRSCLAESARVRVFDSRNRLHSALAQDSDQIVVVDLYSESAVNMIRDFQREHPHVTIIAVGEPRTDPFRAAEKLGLFAVEDVAEIARISRMLQIADELTNLRRENRRLRIEERPRQAPPRTDNIALGVSACLQHFMRIFGEGSDEAVRDHLVEGVASALRVSRVMLFEYDSQSDGFLYTAGRQALASCRGTIFDPDDPFALWLELSGRVIGESTLYNLPPSEAEIVQRALDLLGAVALPPLQVDGTVSGCLFVGPRPGGLPLELADFETLSSVAEFVSAVQAQQRVLAHTHAQRQIFNALANTLSLGLLVVGEDETVRFANDIAQHCLDLPANSAHPASIDRLDSRLAHGLRRAMDGCPEPVSITTINGRKHVWNVDFLPFSQGHGAAALLQDSQTRLPLIAQVSNATRGLPHHVRNQLVAINTFAQLLHEQHEDADFRREFQELVTGEISRILQYVDQAAETG
jgi:hypothetical protein